MRPAEAIQEIIKALDAVFAEGQLNQQQSTFLQSIYKNSQSLAALYADLPSRESALRQLLPKHANQLHIPLNAVQGYAQMLADYPEQFGGELGANQAESMRFVARQAQALSNWYQAILDSAQEEMRREYKASPQACNLQEILLHSEAVLHYLLRQRAIQLKLSYPENLPPIHAASYHLSQLIEHIVTVMAFELVEYGKIEISAEKDSTLVILRIFCTGIGSTNTEIESLFVKNGRHLYRQRFEQQGGRIEFSREAGIGAAIHLCIAIAND